MSTQVLNWHVFVWDRLCAAYMCVEPEDNLWYCHWASADFVFWDRVFHWPAAYQNRLGWLARESRDPRVSDSVVLVEQIVGTYHVRYSQTSIWKQSWMDNIDVGASFTEGWVSVNINLPDQKEFFLPAKGNGRCAVTQRKEMDICSRTTQSKGLRL